MTDDLRAQLDAELAELHRRENIMREARRALTRGESIAAQRETFRQTVLVLALRDLCPFARPLGERGREFDPKNWPIPAAPRVRIPAQRAAPMAETRRQPVPLTAALLRRAEPYLDAGFGYRRLATELRIDGNLARRVVEHYRQHGIPT
ncbi:hypothetical protein DMP17_22255 [Pseudonocardia sp. TMWB2A]|uniref:hypothetical protein n=1 Tax=Pseudonocardia sp. TMWB2A TaxID=687430 RepID=UPI00307E22A4